MPQLTLAAHYGPKVNSEQTQFIVYVHACQQAVLHSELGQYFTPYADDQLHGTLVGLEAVDSHIGAMPAKRCNANLWAQTGELRAMDLDRVLTLARGLHPLTIRFGGFQPGDQTIDSLGDDAFTRSFQIRWRQGKVVIIGWHHVEGDFARYSELWAIRRTFAEQCAVAHKYVRDSDFFVTLGELYPLDVQRRSPIFVKSRASLATALEAAGHRLEARLRRELSDPQRAIDLPVDPGHLSIVRYRETTLNPATSQAFPVATPALNANFLSRLYE